MESHETATVRAVQNDHHINRTVKVKMVKRLFCNDFTEVIC